MMVVLHEELVSIDDMLVEVQCECFVQTPSNGTEDRGDCARVKVGPDASLCVSRQVGLGFGAMEERFDDGYFPGNNITVILGDPS